MKTEEWYLLNSGRGESALNMALDEALLEAMPRLNRPVLRFYGWVETAATFGYFQKYADVERLTPLRPLIRRPTGGGIVPHDRDWTYSVMLPPSHEWYSTAAVESYRRVHDWIRIAFGLLSIVTELAPGVSRAQPGQCFSGCERFDLLCHGAKIAGAAQRRRRDGLLIQGSVQPPAAGAGRVHWEKALCQVGAKEHRILWRTFACDPLLEKRAAELARSKYSLPVYNQKR